MCPAQPLIKYTRLRLISSSSAGRLCASAMEPSDRRAFVVVCEEIECLLWTQARTWECLCIFGKPSQLKWTCCSEIFSNICRPSGCLLSEPLLHSWAAPSTWIKKETLPCRCPWALLFLPRFKLYRRYLYQVRASRVSEQNNNTCPSQTDACCLI